MLDWVQNKEIGGQIVYERKRRRRCIDIDQRWRVVRFWLWSIASSQCIMWKCTRDQQNGSHIGRRISSYEKRIVEVILVVEQRGRKDQGFGRVRKTKVSVECDEQKDHVGKERTIDGDS